MKQDFPGSDKKLDMSISEAPSINNNNKERKLKWQYNRMDYEITAEYNEGAIEYYKEYPYSNLEVYFNSAVSVDVKAELLSQLRPFIGRTW